MSRAMVDVVNTRDCAGYCSSFTRVAQDYEEELEANGKAETPMDLANDDAGGWASATHVAATRASTTWSPNVKLTLARAGSPPVAIFSECS